MIFEAYKISENNYQLFNILNNQRIWLASFNKLNTLLYYYIFCQNKSNDGISFKGQPLNNEETILLDEETLEWNINILE